MYSNMIDATPSETTLSDQRAVLHIQMQLTLVEKSRIPCKQGNVQNLDVLFKKIASKVPNASQVCIPNKIKRSTQIKSLAQLVSLHTCTPFEILGLYVRLFPKRKANIKDLSSFVISFQPVSALLKLVLQPCCRLQFFWWMFLQEHHVRDGKYGLRVNLIVLLQRSRDIPGKFSYISVLNHPLEGDIQQLRAGFLQSI